MKFRCSRDVLFDALQVVQRGISSQDAVPALTGVLMEATAGTGLTLTTTDMEVSARLTVDVQVSEEGVALVPARVLTDTVKSLSDAPVEFEADGVQAWIRCAPYEGTLRLLPAKDFPVVRPPSGAPVVLPAGDFVQAVGQVTKAASRDKARRPVLTGVLLEVGRETATLVATDSYRLAVRELVASAPGEARAIVPKRALSKAAQVVPKRARSKAARASQALDDGEVRIVIEENQASFQIGRLMLTSQLIEGEFPNYRQFIPEGYKGRLTVSREQLMDAVRRVGLLVRDKSPVRMEFNAFGVKLSSQSPDLGQAAMVVEARYEGEELTVAFNPTYLLDGLAAASGESVRIEVQDELKPGVIRGEREDFTYLVMPVRLFAPAG